MDTPISGADIVLMVASYLFGSIPFGYLVARFAGGIDICSRGSGNPGAANVFHILGPGPGMATLLGDVLKGFLPILIVQHLFPGNERIILLCGAAAICGHVWMFFLKFNGGKAVATSAGVFLALQPAAMIPTIAIFVIAVWISRHISVGSIAAALVFPIFTILLGAPLPTTGFAFMACILILIKHVPNMERLTSGSEADYDQARP